jgi:hypothetical protein
MRDLETPWYQELLGLDAGSDERAIKRAYARQLKTTRPDADADAFQRLRAAYEHALHDLRYQDAAPEPEPEPELAAAPPAPLTLEKIAVAPPAPVLLPVPRDAGSPEQHARQAQAAWDDFLETCTLGPLASLAAAQADERLQNFDARDAFELLAARHAADAACPPSLRAALADFFDWTGRGVTVLRRHPDIAATLLGRLGADADWEHLVQQAGRDPLLAHLIADRVPARLPQRWNGTFVRAMRDVLATIRWRHADMLTYRMNQDVFGWWEAQVAGKRYFRQTAGWSIMAGIGLCISLDTVTPASTSLQPLAILFIVCQLLAIGGGAWLAVRPPEALFAHALALQQRWFGKPLMDTRYDRAWQAGWMVPFAMLSVALLVPDPHPLLAAATALGLTLCAALAVLANSLEITRVRFCVAFVLSIAMILGAGAIPAFAAIPEWSMLCFGLCLFTVFLTRGTLLYRMLGWSDTLLARLRLGWLAAGIALAVGVSQDVAPQLQLPALMLLLLTGVLIARYNAGLRLVFIGFVGARALTGALKQSHSDAHFALAILALVTAYFVAAHLFNQADE